MEVEHEQQQQQAQQTQQPQVTNLPLAILATTKTAQLQNGLKHGDYSRYRQYCARRLRGLYKATKFLHGKGRYTKRKLDVAQVTDAKHLHIVLVSAERAWAQAMALKKEAEAEGDGGPVPALRRRALRRLRKAAAWAAQLTRLAAVVCDARGALEAEAYAAWMAGNAAMEGEEAWGAAHAAYARAKTLAAELARLAPDPDAAALWTCMLGELEPALRYCAYQISRSGGGPVDAASLASLARLGSSEPGAGGGLLESKLASLAAQAQTAQAAATSSFEWRGSRCALQLERLRVPLHSAAELAAGLASAMDTDRPADDALPSHDKLINCYSEARGVARTAIKTAAAGGGGPEVQGVDVGELERLETALTGAILEASLARGEVAAAAAGARFDAALARQAAGSGKGAGAGAARQPGGGKGEGRPAKPEDLVRLYTTLSQHASELEEHSSHIGGRAGEALAAAAAARGAAYAARRVYYGAHAALAAGDERLAEAAGLFGRAAERADAAVEAIEELPRGEAACHALLPGLRGLRQAAVGYRLVAAAEAAAGGAAGAAAVTAGVEGMGLTAGQQQQQHLLDCLDAWESFGGAGPSAKGARLVGGPYELAAVAPRAIMVDTAADEVSYPDVSQRCSKKRRTGGASDEGGGGEGGGTFARIGAGLWRGWGAAS